MADSVQVFTGEPGGGNYPVLVAFEDSDIADRFVSAVEGIETETGRIAVAFERIATALENGTAAKAAEAKGGDDARL